MCITATSPKMGNAGVKKDDEQLTSEYLTEIDPADEARRTRAPRTAKEAFGSAYDPPENEPFPWFILPVIVLVLWFVWGND